MAVAVDIADVFVPKAVPRVKRPKVAAALGDIHTFAKMLRVQDKDSKKLIPFKPLPMQTKIFNAVQAGANRIVILKARQVAATTGCKIVMQWLATVSKNVAMHAIVSMRDDSATAMLAENRRWIESQPKLLKRALSTKAKGGLTYADTGASIKAFTSRSTGGGLRSFSPAAAVISEAAYAPDLEEVIAQVDSAVGDGLLIAESTANNPGDFFSQLVMGAPGNGWTLLTLYWWEHPLYCDPAANIPEYFAGSLTPAELQLQERYGLSLGQLHWRRRTEARLGSDHKFRREYPACMDDCFLDREGGYFTEGALADVQVADNQGLGVSASGNIGTVCELEPPHSTDRYVMGVDVGGGVGGNGDASALCVISVATRQPVYTERNNTLSPASWAHRVVQVASRYNGALVLAESNNHGHALLLELSNCHYRNLWMSPTGKPWVTTLASKLEALDTLREAAALLRVIDRVTWLELRSLTIPPGKVAPEAPKGAHDDAAIAIALAYRCLRDIPPSWRAAQAEGGATRLDGLLSTLRLKRLKSSGGSPF